MNKQQQMMKEFPEYAAYIEAITKDKPKPIDLHLVAQAFVAMGARNQ